jgi:hypothetical protein
MAASHDHMFGYIQCSISEWCMLLQDDDVCLLHSATLLKEQQNAWNGINMMLGVTPVTEVDQLPHQ